MDPVKNPPQGSPEAILIQLFGGRLEPARRPVEEIFKCAHGDKPYTLQQHKVWFRRKAKRLEDAKLVQRVYASAAPRVILFLQLTSKGKEVFASQGQEEAPEPAIAQAAGPAPVAPPEHPMTDAGPPVGALGPYQVGPASGSKDQSLANPKPTLDSIRREIKRLCELDPDLEIELSVIIRKGAKSASR